MPRSHSAADDAAEDAAIVVHVIRSGGFAGLRREWRVSAGADERSVWVALLEECPWDDVADSEPRGADRFVWLIDARFDRGERSARLSDDDLHGPWRALVDAVRESAAPARARRVPERGR